MTKTEILKQFFKKFFDIDAHGWGTGSILNDVIENNETLGGGGSGSGSSSGGGTLVIGGFSYDGDNDEFIGTSDKTWREIDNALAAGARCVIVTADTGGHIQMTLTATSAVDGEYSIYGGSSGFGITTTSADSYPSYPTNGTSSEEPTPAVPT